MNIQKLLEKAEEFLYGDERRRKEKRKYLKQVIKKLKKHEKKLVEKLDSGIDADTRAQLEKEIALTHAHRKKGLKVLKGLKKEKKSSGEEKD